MIYVIDLLNDDQLNFINDIYDNSDFTDGLVSVSQIDKEWKNNREMTGYEKNTLSEYMVKLLNASSTFTEITNSISYSNFIFSKYETGMYYHEHNDNYSMNGCRTDFSTTVFLNNPNEYDGGELVLNFGNQSQQYKLNAGQCVIYPTGLLHRVNSVTSGVRKVCCFWTESCIRDAEMRTALADFYVNCWNKYITDAREKMGDDFVNHVQNLLFKIQRKHGDFRGLTYR